MRGEDGALRAFHNVCRHRAAAVVRGDTGNCGHAVRCFYHGWTYGLDGRLKAVPGEASFPDLDKARLRPQAARVRGLAGLRVRALRRQRRERGRAVPALRARAGAPIASRRWSRSAARWEVRDRRRLEERDGQLSRGLSRAGRPSRPVPPVRQQLRGRGAARATSTAPSAAARQGVGQLERARLSAAAAGDGASGRRAAPAAGATTRCCRTSPSTSIRSSMDFFHIVPLAPGRVAAARAHLRPARRRPRPARRALAHLPHQRARCSARTKAWSNPCRPASPPAPTASATSRRRRPACASCTTWCARRSRSPASRRRRRPAPWRRVNAAMA